MPQKWGQHFLVREHYVHRMLRVADLQAGDRVLEVGPGRGMLTRVLLKQGAEVVALEIDPELVTYLQEHLHDSPNLKLEHRDAVALRDEEWQGLHSLPYKIIANLPYQVATTLFYRWWSLRQSLHSLTLLVQLEVAERICATSQDGKAYGALAIAAELGFERHLAFRVPPEAFSPPPKVHSAVVHLVPRPSELTPQEEMAFLEWVQQLFNQRRKTLLNNFQRSFPQWLAPRKEMLSSRYGTRRPEELTLSEWLALFQEFQATVIGAETLDHSKDSRSGQKLN